MWELPDDGGWEEVPATSFSQAQSGTIHVSNPSPQRNFTKTRHGHAWQDLSQKLRRTDRHTKAGPHTNINAISPYLASFNPHLLS